MTCGLAGYSCPNCAAPTIRCGRCATCLDAMHPDWKAEHVGDGAFQVVRYTLHGRKAAEDLGTGRVLVWRGAWTHPRERHLAALFAQALAQKHATHLNDLSRAGKPTERPVDPTPHPEGNRVAV